LDAPAKWAVIHATRVGFVLETTGLDRDPVLPQELERRRPRARVYLEPGKRGGKLVTRWNVIVPRHLRPVHGEMV
jgi:hypothetical protein